MCSRATRTGLAVASVLALATLAACGSTSTTGSVRGPATTAPSAGLDGTTWLLKTFQVGTVATPAVPASGAALTFGSGSALSGSTGCNTFGGTYDATGTNLTLTLGPMTQKACTSVVLQAQEAAVVRLLPQVTGYDLSSGSLTLTGSGNATLLTYTAGATGLEGTSWQVTGVNTGNAVETSALTEALTASFAAGGVFNAFGGCNTMRGTWETSGSNGLTITGISSTMMACAADVSALEASYTAALGKVTSYTLAGDTATLTDSTGATQVSLKQKA